MAESSSTTIRNGVIVGLLVSAAISVFEMSRSVALSILKSIWSGIVWCGESLLETLPVPVWLILITSIITIGVVVIVIVAFFEGTNSTSTSNNAPYLSYIEDHISGAVWRWKWNDNKVVNLTCYCPTCDGQLIYSTSYMYDESSVHFICENCNHNVISKVKGDSIGFAVAATSREIERRVRTKEYKKLNLELSDL